MWPGQGPAADRSRPFQNICRARRMNTRGQIVERRQVLQARCGSRLACAAISPSGQVLSGQVLALLLAWSCVVLFPPSESMGRQNLQRSALAMLGPKQNRRCHATTALSKPLLRAPCCVHSAECTLLRALSA